MNKIKYLIIGAVLSITAGVYAASIPFSPELDARLATIEAGTSLGTGVITATHIATGAVDTAELAAGAVENSDVDAAAAIDFSKLAALPSAQILVGSGSNVATAVAVTGDITVSNAGVTAIGAGKITESMIQASATAGLGLVRVARATYDTAASNGTIGAHALGVTLPAKAVMLGGVIQIVTQFQDSGSGTVALHCEDAGNIKAATDITGSAAQALIATETMPLGAIGSACNITATVAGAEQTAGKLILMVYYVVGE